MKASHLPNPVPHRFTFYPEVTSGRPPGDCKGGHHVLPAPPAALEKPAQQNASPQAELAAARWARTRGRTDHHTDPHKAGPSELRSAAQETDPRPRKCHQMWLHAAGSVPPRAGVAAHPLHPAVLSGVDLTKRGLGNGWPGPDTGRGQPDPRPAEGGQGGPWSSHSRQRARASLVHTMTKG